MAGESPKVLRDHMPRSLFSATSEIVAFVTAYTHPYCGATPSGPQEEEMKGNDRTVQYDATNQENTSIVADTVSALAVFVIGMTCRWDQHMSGGLPASI